MDKQEIIVKLQQLQDNVLQTHAELVALERRLHYDGKQVGKTEAGEKI